MTIDDKRNGPRVYLKLECFGCAHEVSESYIRQGDTGYEVSCTHPTVGKKRVGDSSWVTPKWCPLLATALEAARLEMFGK